MTPARDPLRAAITDLLLDRRLTNAQLARQLTDAAKEHGLASTYDSAVVTRWRDGSTPVSRQATYLLDLLHPRPEGRDTFQDLRDQYLLENDREQLPAAARSSDGFLLTGTRYGLDHLARRAPRRPLPLAGDEVVALAFYRVADCDRARETIDALVEHTPEVRVLALYDVLGRWDVAARFAGPAGYDLAAFHHRVVEELVAESLAESDTGTEHRLVAAEASRVRRADGDPAPPEFLVLDRQDDYDRLRVQRAFLHVELRDLRELKRPLVRQAVESLLTGPGFADPYRGIVEAVTLADDAVVLDLAMTASEAPYLHRLHRVLGPVLTKYRARRTTLLVFSWQESGWTRGTRP